MRIFIKRWLPLLLITALVIAFGGCSKKVTDPKASAAPSASPMASPSQDTAGRASEMPSASPSAGAEQSENAQGSAEASTSPDTTAEADTIEGFMEGAIVDPEDAPALVALLAEHSEYKDMSIQSITYKLYEGRQAYYVILQGEGEASHPVYVFADDTVMAEEA